MLAGWAGPPPTAGSVPDRRGAKAAMDALHDINEVAILSQAIT
jgi:hypothetical protein